MCDEPAPSVSLNFIIFTSLPQHFLNVDTVISGLVSSFSHLMMPVLLYFINPERQIFAEHYTAVRQPTTALPQLYMKIPSFSYDVCCFLSSFNWFQLL